MVTTKHKLTVNIQNINHSTIHIIKRIQERKKGEKKESTKKLENKQNGKIASQYLLIITLNVHVLNPSFKKHRVTEWTRPDYMLSMRGSLQL